MSCYIEACGLAPSAAVGSLGAGVGLWESAEVRVNAVLPGYVDTPWQHNALGMDKAKQAAEHYSGMVALKDYARPEDIAETIV